MLNPQNVFVTYATRRGFQHFALLAENRGYTDGGLVIGGMQMIAWARRRILSYTVIERGCTGRVDVVSE
jgi:hypothetical protein